VVALNTVACSPASSVLSAAHSGSQAKMDNSAFAPLVMNSSSNAVRVLFMVVPQ